MLWLQHGVTKMHAGGGQREHLGEKNSLIDLDAVFFRLHQPAFRVDLPLRRRQARHQLARLIGKLVDSQEILKLVGEFAINALGMRGKKAFARSAA